MKVGQIVTNFLLKIHYCNKYFYFNLPRLPKSCYLLFTIYVGGFTGHGITTEDTRVHTACLN